MQTKYGICIRDNTWDNIHINNTLKRKTNVSYKATYKNKKNLNENNKQIDEERNIQIREYHTWENKQHIIINIDVNMSIEGEWHIGGLVQKCRQRNLCHERGSQGYQ